jgi:transcription antitermination factor NusA-like protein/uncharacterized LabA/DUF88 family protein
MMQHIGARELNDEEQELIAVLREHIPEIRTGAIIVCAVARIRGKGAKVAVAATRSGIDPLGACIGLGAQRVQSLQEALGGEPVSFLVWSDREEELLARAAGPVDVRQVEIDLKTREARIYVPASEMHLAIGRDGNNMRLAARLLRMRRIEVKAVEEVNADGGNEMVASNCCAASRREERISHVRNEGKTLPVVTTCAGECSGPTAIRSRERDDSGSWGGRLRRVGVFVDVGNIYGSVRRAYGHTMVNYEALRDYLTKEDAIVTLIAFAAYDPGHEQQQQFLDRLAAQGFRVVMKPVKRFADGSVKGDMDMEMAVEVLTSAPHLDEIVLVTGDGDFVPVVDYLARLGKTVRVIGPELYTAVELIRSCHQFTSLGDVPGIYGRELVTAPAGERLQVTA